MSTAAAPSRPGVDGHAGEGEISNVMASRPELAHPERSSTQSGADLNRLELPEGLYTGIWWYAKFPNHYQGDSTAASAARGAATTKAVAVRIANAIRAVKRDEMGPRLQKEFFEKAGHRLQTSHFRLSSVRKSERPAAATTALSLCRRCISSARGPSGGCRSCCCGGRP